MGDSGLVWGAALLALALGGVAWSAAADGPVEGEAPWGRHRRRLRISVGLFVAFAIVGLLTYLPAITAADREAVHSLHLSRDAWDAPLLHRISGLGGGQQVYWLPLVFAAVLLFRRRAFRFFTAALLGGAGLSMFFKALFHRVRPDLAHGHHADSFPSGHTLGAAVLAGALLLVWLPACRAPWQRVLLWVLAGSWPLLMALARVSLGAHYPTDTLGSLALGAGWVCLCHALQEWWSERGSASAPRPAVPATEP